MLRFASVLATILLLAGFAEAASDPDDLGQDRYLCPADTELVASGQCRGHCDYKRVFTPGIQRNIDHCKSVNAWPVTIKNDEEQSYWLAKTTNIYYLPIGIVCDELTMNYKWIDGSEIEYKPYNYDDALDGKCRSDVWWYLDITGYWWHRVNTAGTYNYNMCCVADIYHPELSDDGCVDFNDDEEDSVCYQISETFENWSDAQKICKSFGSTVASIHNEHENSYLRRLAVSRGFTNGLLLGAATGGKTDAFVWADGSSWDYSNFAPGFPNDVFGNCLAMDTNDTAAQWANFDCAVKLPFVCARKPDSVPVSGSTCPGSNVKEGDIITSPGYPTNASIPCEFFLKVDPGKKVEMEIIVLEANTCCDQLLLYEGAVGGTLIANVAGAVAAKTYMSSTDEMTVSWQPNGGLNVRGLMFTFRAV